MRQFLNRGVLIRMVVAVVALPVAMIGLVDAAAASTALPPPTITPPSGDTVPLRTDVTITLSDPGQQPVFYIVGLNSAPPVILDETNPPPGWTRVEANPDGAETATQLRFHTPGPNTIYAYAVDSAGNHSVSTNVSVFVAALTTPDVLGDFTGDGRPDLLVVGSSSDPGLWLHAGTDDAGHVDPVGVQVGGEGTGFEGGSGGPADWTGTAITYGDFDNDGMQDILVHFPTNNGGGSNLEILPGNGDGLPFLPATLITVDLPRTDGTAGDEPNISHVAAAPDNQCTSVFTDNGLLAPAQDIYATVGDSLYLYVPASLNGTAYELASADSACSSNLSGGLVSAAGWSNVELTGGASPDGAGPTFFARNTATGALVRWLGTAFDAATGAQGVPAGAPNSTSFGYATSGWGSATYPTVTAADLNHDTQADLWATTGTGVDAFLHATDTTFAPATHTSFGQAPTYNHFGPSTTWSTGASSGTKATFAADVNGDGAADLIAVNGNGTRVQLAQGGHFGPSTAWSTVASSGTKATLAADVNGDGSADLIAVNGNGTRVQLAQGDHFAAPTTWSTVAFTDTKAMLAADVNGDGAADLIAVNGNGTRVQLAQGGHFAAPTTWSTVASSGTKATLAADVNGDGAADLIAVNGNGTRVQLAQGGHFAAPTTWSTVASSGTKATLAADVNGDGAADLVAVSGNGATVQLAQGNGFASPVAWSTAAFTDAKAIFAADVNADGAADLVAVNANSTSVQLAAS